MPEFSKPCDVYQGYNYRKDKQTPVGFITALKIGDTTLTADQTVKDPENPATDLSVVAVLSGASWGLGVTDSVYFSGQVTAGNQQNVKTLSYTDMTKVDIEYQFTVYEYDPLQKKYYKCLKPESDGALKGLLEKNNGELTLAVADDPSNEVQSPRNFSFHIGIKPQSASQQITIATAVGKNIVKQWGLTESTS